MSESNPAETSTPQSSFDTYPTHRVCGIFENNTDAKKALDGLDTLSIRREDIDIYGKSDSSDLGPIVNTAHGMGDVEDEAFQVYQSALDKGNYVFAVHVANDEMKDSVSAILTNNQAHYVNYFGSWVVEGL